MGDPLLAELEMGIGDGSDDIECDCQEILDTFVEVDNFIPIEDCERYINRAELVAAKEGWGKEAHGRYATRDVKARALGGTVLSRFMQKVQEPTLDVIAQEFKLPRELLVVDDAFIVRYAIGAGEQRSLEWHRDGSIISAIFSLSDSSLYEEGGTVFRDGMCYVPEQGSGIIFPGQRLHFGRAITSGERYIATLFIKCGEFSCREEAITRDNMDYRKLTGEEYEAEGIGGDLVGALGSMMGWETSKIGKKKDPNKRRDSMFESFDD